MEKCICDSDKESRFICMKDNVYLCEDCLKCRNPDIYCKYRTACPIWFMEKKGLGWDLDKKRKEPDAAEIDLSRKSEPTDSQ